MNQMMLSTIIDNIKWRTRPLSGDYPYVYVDGIFLKHSWSRLVKSIQKLNTSAVRFISTATYSRQRREK